MRVNVALTVSIDNCMEVQDHSAHAERSFAAEKNRRVEQQTEVSRVEQSRVEAERLGRDILSSVL